MKNPWTKKNPYLSIWLSGANAVLGATRGQATAQVRREVNSAIQQSTRQMTDAWITMLVPPKAPRKRKKR
ncbi:hypothetical protein D3871_17870 [Noviherbaspirillum saxi]|uniref:Uncharacterized protein n=2 Tax=Noviherbaspirillum saxi TaxID=2320863 RepID=A0A3A3G4C7_9BURK|nr:hypothetical protein [Noviherbaspirillum saxi]RJF96276.1 hypothetical protein D3871_17870 [Noviherbaspirillum saxi]